MLPEASRLGRPTTGSESFRTPCSNCGARVYGLELGCWCSDTQWVGTVVSCQVVRERLLFVVVDGLVSKLGVVGDGRDAIVVTARRW